jgi:diphthamide biosynthesis methyltransferase
LLLLDYEEDKKSSIQPDYAISILEEAEKSYKKGIIKEDTKLIVLHSLCMIGEKKIVSELKDARKLKFSDGPTVFIIPADTTDIEVEVMDAIFGA